MLISRNAARRHLSCLLAALVAVPLVATLVAAEPDPIRALQRRRLIVRYHDGAAVSCAAERCG